MSRLTWIARLSWIAMVIAVGSPPCVIAQQRQPGTSAASQTVYEYQLNYELPWQRWYGGPGLSIGGTMPTRGAFGYSSMNGLPLPAPLGGGVYVNQWDAPGGPLGGPPIGSPFGPGPMPFPTAGPLGSSGPTTGLGNQAIPESSRVESQTKSSRRPRPAPASPPGARRASVEQQNLGDEKLRQQAWPRAYVHYRNAADLAPERPEAHFRLGLVFAAMRQYASAVREFKRSLDLDSTLPQSGETLSTIFGAENTDVQTKILPSVADWAHDDLKDTDRLFLLGLLLNFNEDPRGSELMEAALRTDGSNRYLLAFVAPANSLNGNRLPGSPPRHDSKPSNLPASGRTVLSPDQVLDPPLTDDLTADPSGASSPRIPPVPAPIPEPPPT